MAISPWFGARPREMALCASCPTGEKKREKDTHAYITLYQSFISAVAHCHSGFSAEPAETNSTQGENACALLINFSCKLYSEKFKIWCKHSTLGDTSVISNVSLCSSTFLWNNRAKYLPSLPSHCIFIVKTGSVELAHLAIGWQPVFMLFPPFSHRT